MRILTSKSSNEKNVILSVRVPESTAKKFRKFAEAKKTRPSYLLRDLITIIAG